MQKVKNPLPMFLTLACICEEVKAAHPHSKTTFLRFAHKGGYMFNKKTEIDLKRCISERSSKILEYSK